MTDIQDFMKKYYGYRPDSMLTLQEFCDWKDANGHDNEWDYPLGEYEHLAENKIKAVPVRFSDGATGYDYRFCEIPN